MCVCVCYKKEDHSSSVVFFVIFKLNRGTCSGYPIQAGMRPAPAEQKRHM